MGYRSSAVCWYADDFHYGLTNTNRDTTVSMIHTYTSFCLPFGQYGGNLLKQLPRVNREHDPVEDKKVDFLIFQKLYFNFAVFLSKFMKTYILLNFIQYYKKFLRRNHTFYHYT